MDGTITGETKREGQKKVKRRTTCGNRKKGKKGRELVPLMVGNYLTHDPSIVTCMQIMRSNSNGGSITSITR